MALEEYLGAIVMEIDGKEYEVESLDVKRNLGRRLVKTMNRSGRPKGFAKGIEDINLQLMVPIPKSGAEPDWAALTGAKITLYPLAATDKRTSYLDCFTVDVGEKYAVDGEAKRDISMVALRVVKE